MANRRYYVAPCDDCGSLLDAKRPRTWDVLDRDTGACVANFDTRAAARRAAREYSNPALPVSQLAAWG